METQLLDQSCKDFLTDLASKEQTPGGGGAAALDGAIAAALTSMVSNLTLGKEKFADVEDKIRPLLVSAEILRTRMLALVAADAAVFSGVPFRGDALQTAVRKEEAERADPSAGRADEDRRPAEGGY